MDTLTISSDEKKATTSSHSKSNYNGRLIGFDATNRDIIAPSFICQLCGLILRNPMQLFCGHRQCRSCIFDNLESDFIKCPECQERMAKNNIVPDKGFVNDMRRLLIICVFCEWNGVFNDYEIHLQREHTNVQCKDCKETFDTANDIFIHRRYYCDKVTVSCALKDFGCSNSIRRVELGQHYSTEQHQMAIVTFLRRLISKSIGGQHGGVFLMDDDAGAHHSTMSNTATINQIQEVSEAIDILAGGVQTLNVDLQRLDNESKQIDNGLKSLDKDISTLKISIQEQNTYLDALKPNQEVLLQDVTALKQKVEDSRFASYNGTHIWKITNVNQKMNDAQTEQQTSFYSPPFYSSPTGYKMRARLYLFGDGNARRTHMSLFFVLMRGEYDAILKYPFNYKVTFCLYDQTPAQNHIVDSFRPDIKSSSFQRPRSEMNIASGIPKFVSLSTIQQNGNPYIHEDTMFIKIMIDFIEIPKTVLPYAMSLNPGLPVNIQYSRIKEEDDKRSQ